MEVNGYEIKPGADLRGAYLRGADLRGADLRDADLRDATLRNANLRDATLPDNVYNINSLPADLPEDTQRKLATLLVHKDDWLEGIGGWLTHELVLVEEAGGSES